MTSFKLIGAALMLSAAFVTPVFAQSAAGLPELPGDYAFFNLAPGGDLRIGSAFAPAEAVTVQPPPVVVARVTRPVRPHRAHHISSTGASEPSLRSVRLKRALPPAAS
jgi:hypothetical protein